MTTKNIRAIMAKKGWDKKRLAFVVGVSVRTVEGWLGNRRPSKLAIRTLEGL